MTAFQERKVEKIMLSALGEWECRDGFKSDRQAPNVTTVTMVLPFWVQI